MPAVFAVGGSCRERLLSRGLFCPVPAQRDARDTRAPRHWGRPLPPPYIRSFNAYIYGLKMLVAGGTSGCVVCVPLNCAPARRTPCKVHISSTLRHTRVTAPSPERPFKGLVGGSSFAKQYACGVGSVQAAQLVQHE